MYLDLLIILFVACRKCIPPGRSRNSKFKTSGIVKIFLIVKCKVSQSNWFLHSKISHPQFSLSTSILTKLLKKSRAHTKNKRFWYFFLHVKFYFSWRIKMNRMEKRNRGHQRIIPCQTKEKRMRSFQKASRSTTVLSIFPHNNNEKIPEKKKLSPYLPLHCLRLFKFLAWIPPVKTQTKGGAKNMYALQEFFFEDEEKNKNTHAKTSIFLLHMWIHSFYWRNDRAKRTRKIQKSCAYWMDDHEGDQSVHQ